jgi:hypothetical protein
MTLTHSVMLRKPNIIKNRLPRTHKVIGGHLSAQSFADYAGHLFLVPEGELFCVWHGRITQKI